MQSFQSAWKGRVLRLLQILLKRFGEHSSAGMWAAGGEGTLQEAMGTCEVYVCSEKSQEVEESQGALGRDVMRLFLGEHAKGWYIRHKEWK